MHFFTTRSAFMMDLKQTFDVIVVGGGHAGIACLRYARTANDLPAGVFGNGSRPAGAYRGDIA